jgi:hypothetical protein
MNGSFSSVLVFGTKMVLKINKAEKTLVRVASDKAFVATKVLQS